MKQRNAFTVMRSLSAPVKPLSGYMVLAIFMGLVGNLAASFITIFGGFLILQLMGFSVGLSKTILLTGLLLFGILRGALRYAEQACNHFIAFKILAILRDRVFRALRRLCPAKLEGRDKGNLISLITSDIELLEVFYAHTISPVAIASLFTVVMVLFIGSYHWLLGLTALVCYLLVGVAIPIFTSSKSGNSGMQYRTAAGELSTYVLDSLHGLFETLQYGKGAERIQNMQEKTKQLSIYGADLKRGEAKNAAVTNLAVLLCDMLMLIVSALLYREGQLDFVGVCISTLALFSSFGPTVALAALGSTLQSTIAAGNRVLDILEETPQVEEQENGKDIAFTHAKVENVNFAYGEEQILQDISMDIPKGKLIGIVGKSGSGKSTLLKLLMRFWDVDSGKISLSDTEIGAINTKSLRENESYMTQETWLFQDTIRNNIRIASLDATDAQIEQAAKKASIHDFIMQLPKGYDTEVGELGDTLSGGEKQRIGLARAFLHDAPFVLLDEPTGNLDSLNEAVILKSLCEEKKDKTVLLVSHRQSTLRMADTVYSVESGRMS